MKGRLTYQQVNTVIDELNKAFTAKYKLLRQKKSTLNDRNRKRYETLKMQESKDTKGSVFFSLKVCHITGNGGQGKDGFGCKFKEKDGFGCKFKEKDGFGCKFKEKDGFERAVVSAHRGGLSSPLRDIETTISHEHCANQLYQNEKCDPNLTDVQKELKHAEEY